MHNALAMNTSGYPLGIVHQKIWAPKADKAATTRRDFPIEDKETIKWINTLKAVNEYGASSLFQQEVVLISDSKLIFSNIMPSPGTTT